MESFKMHDARRIRKSQPYPHAASVYMESTLYYENIVNYSTVY